MSTPPGKPRNPIDLSTHVSHKAHEGAVTEPPRSPYAPKQAHQRAGTERHPVENNPLRSPYAPKQARVTSDVGAGDDSLPSIRTPRGLREHTGRYDVGSHEAVHPNIGRHKQPPAEHRDESMSDRDLEQLEASLRLLQRQESTTRSPRATHLAPGPGLAPVDTRGRRQSGERFGDGFRLTRSLEPERLSPPPEPRRDISAPVGIVVAIIFVVTIAHYFAVGGWAPRQNLRLGRKRHPIRPCRRPGLRANKGPGRIKVIIVRRRRRARYPPRVPRRRSQQHHPRARPRVSPALKFRLRATPRVCLIPKRSSYS
jgi:hypothetical protein